MIKKYKIHFPNYRRVCFIEAIKRSQTGRIASPKFGSGSEMQDKSFKKMSAQRKIDLASMLTEFCLMLNKLK